MKITVKLDDVSISIEEIPCGNNTRIRYEDERNHVIATIKVMADECIRMRKSAHNKESHENL